ncbi:hypothetical protein GCM10027291_22660 [Telluribacter humicola]
MLSTIRFSQADWYRLLGTWVVVADLVALGGLFFEIEKGNEYRIASTLGNPSYLAHYLLSSFILLGLVADASNIRKYFMLFAGGAGVLLAGIFFTFTRTTYIGLMLGGLTFLILQGRHLRFVSISKIKKLATVIFPLVLLIVGFCIYHFERLAYSVVNTNTVQDRFRLWRIAWQGIQQRPLLGWGTDNFPYVYQKYMRKSMALQKVWYDRSHNVFLDWFINGGLLSGLLYLAIWGLLLWYIWKTSLSAFRKSLLTSWWVVSVFYLAFNIDNLPNWILLLLVTFYVLNHLPEGQLRVVTNPKAIRIISLAYVLAGLCIIKYSLLPTTYAYLLARKYAFSYSPEEKMLLIRDMLDRGFPSNYNLAGSVADYTYTVLHSDVSDKVKHEYSQLAYRFILDESAKRPPSLYLLLKKADLSTLLARDGEAIKSLREVLRVNPVFAMAYLRIGYLYFARKQHREALEYFNKAAEVSPELTEAKLMKIRTMPMVDAGYDVAGELKKISGERLVDHAHLVSTIFRESGKMREYLVWMWKGAYHTESRMKPQVLYEWARCSYEVGDLSSLKNVLEIYKVTFHCSPQFSKDVLDLAQQGVDPSTKLLEFRSYIK